jgi:two-component system sensor histidine kinase RegB
MKMKEATMSQEQEINPATVVSNTVLENVRWIALVGQITAIAFVHFVLQFTLPLIACLMVVATSAFVGIWQSIHTRRNKKMSRKIVFWLLGFDTVQLGVLIYLTGGIVNPFAIMLLAPVTVSATVLPRKNTMILAGLVVTMATFLAFYHNPLPWGDTTFVLPDLYISGLWTALVLTTLFVAAYAGIVARNSRQLARGLTEARLTIAREQQMVALGSLATSAAHKLGSPLNTITLIAHELNQSDRDADSKLLREDIEMLKTETERCRMILAELNQDAIKLGQEMDDPIPIRTMIRGLIDERFEDSKGMVSLSFDGDDQVLEPMVIRRPELIHPVETILDNAVQFAEKDIELIIRYDDHQVAITISDDGPGFRSSILSNIGDPYNTSRAGTNGHMGLGVFIAMTMVEQIGGKLILENRKTGGASVMITYPREMIETKAVQR